MFHRNEVNIRVILNPDLTVEDVQVAFMVDFPVTFETMDLIVMEACNNTAQRILNKIKLQQQQQPKN